MQHNNKIIHSDQMIFTNKIIDRINRRITLSEVAQKILDVSRDFSGDFVQEKEIGSICSDHSRCQFCL
jgi:hypothetical protein